MPQLILRLQFLYNVKSLEQQLMDFFQYTIPGLINQSDSDFICFVGYDKKVEKEFVIAYKTSKLQDPRFIFTPSMKIDSHNYLKTIDLEAVNDLRFIQLCSYQSYPLDMLEKIRNYPADTRVLLLNDRYLYNTTNFKIYLQKEETTRSFVYICSVLEYKRLFFLYDQLYPQILYRYYLQMPHQQLPIDAITFYKSIPNTLVSEQLAENDKLNLLKNYQL